MVLNHALQFRFRGRPFFVDLFEERKDGEKGRHGDRIESVREEEWRDYKIFVLKSS